MYSSRTATLKQLLRSAMRQRFAAVLVSLVALTAALPAAPDAVGSPLPEGATVSATSAGGSAPEVLQRLTVAQLAAALYVSPAQLALQLQSADGPLAGELVTQAQPSATLAELLNTLGADGASTAPVQQAIGQLLLAVTETPQQLQTTFDRVLADLNESGKLAALARELGLPVSSLETPRLMPTTAEDAAASLDTTTEHLSTELLGASATMQPLTSQSPLVTAPVQRVGEGELSMLIGIPSGSGGLSLTTVNSSAAAPGTAPSATVSRGGAVASNAFSIVSIKVIHGAILETVRLPGTGRVGIATSVRRTVALRSNRGRHRTVTRNSPVGKVTAELVSGQHTIVLRPKGLPGGHAAVVVNLATTYTPTGGVPRTIQRRVTVSRVAGKRRHR
jgi:hypothetical protein